MESLDAASSLSFAVHARAIGEWLDVSREPEGPWVAAMVRAKATDPRNGRPSWNRLAELAGVSTSTITLMVEGRRKTSLETVRKVADALRVSPSEVGKWLGREQDVRPWDVPAEVELLTERQQKALTELIRAIAAADTTGGEHGGDTAATRADIVWPEAGSGRVTLAEVKGDQPAKTRRRTDVQQVQKKAARKDPRKD